jgi:DNA adenine methylase
LQLQLEIPKDDNQSIAKDLKKTKTTYSGKVPHPIPYQGSKRKLANTILSYIESINVDTFYEVFAGSAALTLAAADRNIGSKYHINDCLVPLMGIWDLIVMSPKDICDSYESIWKAHIDREPNYFFEIRNEFNRDGDPRKLLYLLARCVKSAVRFNSKGEFNQSFDKRRLGTKPETMKKNIELANKLLANRTNISSVDFREVTSSATPEDLIYMDPPWQGTSTGKDNRYFKTLQKKELFDELEELNLRSIPFILSFDGRCGDRVYGEPVPSSLKLTLVELDAGRSSQATLTGKSDVTIESLYLSPALVEKAMNAKHNDQFLAQTI